MNDVNEPVNGAATVRSPQERRLAALSVADGGTAYVTVCRARVTGPLADPGLLSAAAAPAIQRLLAETGHAEGPRDSYRLDVAVHGVEHEVILRLPAACADETTAVALLRELLGADDPAPEPLRHEIAARWWDTQTRAPEASSAREYWRAEAAGWDRPLPEAFRGPEPGRGGFPVGEVETTLAPALAARLRDAPGPASRLLAAWGVVLHRHAGLARPVVGVATDLRRYAELRGCRGPLTAYLPVRVDVAMDDGLATHADAIGARLRTAAGRAEWFAWESALAGPAPREGFPAGFRYLEVPGAFTSQYGTVTVEDLDSRSDRFALRLLVSRFDDRIEVRLEYDRARVAPTLAAELIAEVVSVLGAGTAEPDRPAGRLPLVPAAVLDRLTVAGQGPDLPLPTGGVPAMIRHTAARAPDAVAVRADQASLTYAGLLDRVDRLAGALRTAGVRPDDRVGVHLSRGLDLLPGLLGVWAAGAAYVYLDPEHPADRLAALVADGRCTALVSGGPAEWAPSDVPTVSVRAGGPPAPARVTDLGEVAYLLYTSGSTGAPRGVAVPHRGLVNYLLGVAADWTAHDHSFVSTTAAFDLSLPALFLPLLHGGTVTMAPPGRLDAEALADALTGATVYTVVKLTPTQLSTLRAELAGRAAAGRPARVTARRFAVGGEPLPAALVRAWHEIAPTVPLVNHYGPTETVGARLHGRAEPHVPGGPTGTVALGQPIANTRVAVVGDDFAPVPTSVVGELTIAGAGLAYGYLGQPGCTAERFRPDPAGPPGSRRYHTGDLARRLPDGSLEFVGRADHQLKIRGNRVEPAEAAAALASHPRVRQAVVIGRTAPNGAVSLVGYAVAGADGPVPVDELRKHAAKRVPDYLLPAAVVWLPELPLTPGGKLDRRALPEPEPERPAQAVVYEPPRDRVEQILAEVWAEVLGLDRVGVHDNFFAVGGDSILSILVASRAARHGLKMSLRLFYEQQTIAEMTPYVEPISPATTQTPGGTALTPVQHWFFEQATPVRGHWNQGWLLAVRDTPDGSGDLDPVALATAVAAVVRHHPALRTRFVADPQAPGGHRPEIEAEPLAIAEAFRHVRVTNWPNGVTVAVAALQEFDLSSAPLIRVALLDGGRPDRQRLALIAHHLVIDTVSWQILLEDLRTAYRSIRAGGPVELPPTTAAPHEWGATLAAAVGRFTGELDYWLAQSPAGLTPLPVDHPEAGIPIEADRCETVAELDAERTRFLLRRMPVNTRVDHALLTAVALAVGDWTGQSDVHVTVEGQGRAPELVEGPELFRSVGWFTALAPLLLRLPGADPLDALRAVKEQVHAMPGAGIGYGVLRYLAPGPGQELAARPRPQISVNYIGQTGGGVAPAADAAFDLPLGPAPEPLSPLLHASAPRDRHWGVNGVVRGDVLRVVVDYPGRHYNPATGQRFADRIVHHLRQIVDAATAYGPAEPTPSDFPALGGHQDRLNAILAQATARVPAPAQPT